MNIIAAETPLVTIILAVKFVNLYFTDSRGGLRRLPSDR